MAHDSYPVIGGSSQAPIITPDTTVLVPTPPVAKPVAPGSDAQNLYTTAAPPRSPAPKTNRHNPHPDAPTGGTQLRSGGTPAYARRNEWKKVEKEYGEDWPGNNTVARTGNRATGPNSSLPQINTTKMQAIASHVPGITVAENLFVETGVQMQVSDTPVAGTLYRWQAGDTWQGVLSTLYPDRYPAPPATFTPEQQQMLSDDVKVIARVTVLALMAQQGISLDSNAGRQKFHDLVNAAVFHPNALDPIALPDQADQVRLVAQRLHRDADPHGQIVDVRQQRLIAQYGAILHEKTKHMTPEQVHGYLLQHLKPRPDASGEDIQRARAMQAHLDTVWQHNAGHETEFVEDFIQAFARRAAAPRDAERREREAQTRPTRTFAAIPTEILTTPRTSPQVVTAGTNKNLAASRLRMAIAPGLTTSSAPSTTGAPVVKTSSAEPVGQNAGSPTRTVIVKKGQALSAALQTAGLPHDKATLQSVMAASNGKIKNVDLVQPGAYVVPATKGSTATGSSTDIVDIPDPAADSTDAQDESLPLPSYNFEDDAWRAAMASTMNSWDNGNPHLPGSTTSPYDEAIADTDRDLLGAIGKAEAQGMSREKSESMAAKGLAQKAQAEANVQKKKLDHNDNDRAHERNDISNQQVHNNDVKNANEDIADARLSPNIAVARTPFPASGR